MIAVIFEVELEAGRRDEYLSIAAGLAVELRDMDGFVSIERFESLSRPGCLLSLSIWRDEEAVRRWRQRESHQAAQAQGRAGIFRDYRLRVAHIVRSYGLDDRAQAPADARQVHG